MQFSPSVDLALPGCHVLTLDRFADGRGVLRALDLRGLAGFDAARFFLTSLPDDTDGLVRGGHANSTPEVLVAVAGHLTVDLDSGAATASVRLDRPDVALVVGPGILLHLRDFAPGTVLLGLAADPYADTQRFPDPQPGLFPQGVAP